MQRTLSRWTLAVVALLLATQIAASEHAAIVYARTASARASQPDTSKGITISLPLVIKNRSTIVNGSLQAALDAAKPGDVIVLQHAIYSEKVRIRRAGTDRAPITLVGAGAGATTIQGGVQVEAPFWSIQNLDVQVNDDSDGVRIKAPAHHITLQRVHIFGGGGYGVRVGNDTSDILIEDSQIDHFDAGSSDAHGIGIMTASNITVRRCDIHDNSGDAIQSNTPDYPGYGRFASNILIEDNALHDNRENALDIKSTHGLTARNNRVWGFRAVDSSDGMAIQVQYDAQDILLAGNQIWDAVEGIEVSRGTKNGQAYPAAPQRVLIAGNLLRDLVADARGDSGSGSGIVIRTSSNVKVYNNTVLRAADSALYLSSSSDDTYPRQVDIRNNAFDGKGSDLRLAIAATAVAGLIIDYNHYVNGRVSAVTSGSMAAGSYDRHATTGAPQLDANFLPMSNSPLHDSGTDVGLFFTDKAPDRGWGEITSKDAPPLVMPQP